MKADRFFGHVALYARTVYAGALALALPRTWGIARLGEGVAAAGEPLSRSGMAGLERELATFPHRLWWQQLPARWRRTRS